jgi:hypothetical protein
VSDLPSCRDHAAKVLFAPHPSNPRSSCRWGWPPPLELERCFPSVASSSPPTRAFSKLRCPRPPNRHHRLVTSVGRLHLSPSQAIVVPSVWLMTIPLGGGGVAGMVPAASSPPSPSPGAIWSTFRISVLCSDPSCSCPCAVVELMAPWCGGASRRAWSSATLHRGSSVFSVLAVLAIVSASPSLY